MRCDSDNVVIWREFRWGGGRKRRDEAAEAEMQGKVFAALDLMMFQEENLKVSPAHWIPLHLFLDKPPLMCLHRDHAIRMSKTDIKQQMEIQKEKTVDPVGSRTMKNIVSPSASKCGTCHKNHRRLMGLYFS